MTIYRAEQVLFSIGSEPGTGGYLDYISSATDAGDAATTLTEVHTPGTQTLTVAAVGAMIAGDYVRIGTGTNAEIRRVLRISGATLIYLDYPLGFYHANGEGVDEKTVDLGASNKPVGTSLISFLPGVYESITVPDMATEFVPQYFLGASNRNFYYMYRGKQSFSGSLPNFILLNGYALRFPIGRVRTVATAVSGGSTTLAGAHFKGEREVDATNGTNFSNGDYIEIERGGTNPEVRQIISGASGAGAQTFVLNYPLMFAHANGVTIAETTAGTTFTHTISEMSDLDTVTWHVRNRDEDEDPDNDWVRRFVGGHVSRATISADEGDMLRMSWDDVPFIDMAHNQLDSSAVTGNVSRATAAMIDPAGIGGDTPHSGAALGTPLYATTEPYYFSQGSVSLFGVTFARIRNFRIEINNNVTPEYYIQDQTIDRRIPSEMHEQRREYRMSATVALPNAVAATANTRTLFKELLSEGNLTAGFSGFDVSLAFTRGTSDTITITIPPSSASSAGESQGAFISRASTSVGTDSPVQADVEIMFRSMQIAVVDSIPVYP